MAYLTMMAVRLVELHRVLKPTGSLYLHCDPTASHYIKLLLDAIFGHKRFLSEIVWKRTSAHSSANDRDHPTTFCFYTVNRNLIFGIPFLPYMTLNISNLIILRQTQMVATGCLIILLQWG